MFMCMLSCNLHVVIILLYFVIYCCFIICYMCIMTSAKEVMFLLEFVCLSVSKITQKVMDLSEIFRECREWHKLQVIQFWG